MQCEQSAKPLHEGLEKFEDNMNQDFRKSRLSKEDLELSDQAYTLLALLCTYAACACGRSAERLSSMARPLESANCSECDRPFESATGTNIYVTRPTHQSSTMEQKCWEYATRTGERVSDGIRSSVYMHKIAPQDMRQHLMLNRSRLSTAEEVAQEIEDFWDASEEFSA